MKLQNQVCTLQQAKRLKELGVVQNSYFYWLVGDDANLYTTNEAIEIFKDAFVEHEFKGETSYSYNGEKALEIGKELFEEAKQNREIEGWDCISSAFTVGELGALLDRETAAVIESVDRTEAESRAKTLIYLLEEKLIHVDAVNQLLLNA